jgi:hypothetical protein
MPFGEYSLPEFPVNALPEWLRLYVCSLSEQTQTPIDLPGVLSLAVLALCVAKKARIQARAGWSEPLNLYTVTVLPPASRKSAVFSDLLSPINEWEQAECERMRPIIAVMDAERKMMTSRFEKATKEASTAKDTLARQECEEEVRRLAEQIAAFRVPASPRLLTKDCTPERLNGLLAEQNGRMGLFSPEGDVFDMIAGRYSDKGPVMTPYLEAHNGDTLIVDRQTRTEYISDPALSMGLTVQPDVLRGLSAKPQMRGRGLLARFFYSLPPDNIGWRRIETGKVGEEALRSYRNGINRLQQWEPERWEENGPFKPIWINLSPEAQKIFDAWCGEIEERLRPEGDLGTLTDWGGKLCGGVARIAGVLHLAEYGETVREVSAPTMQAAITVGEYFAAHAKAAFGEMNCDQDTDHARYLLKWILRTKQTTFTRREAQRSNQSRFKSAEHLDKPLKILIERGYIRPLEKEPVAFRPSEQYAVNPHIASKPMTEVTKGDRNEASVTSVIQNRGIPERERRSF